MFSSQANENIQRMLGRHLADAARAISPSGDLPSPHGDHAREVSVHVSAPASVESPAMPTRLRPTR